MIFVLTGTTYAFDPLVKAIDAIAPSLKEKVIIQTGTSTYVPKNCEYFAFAPNVDNYIRKASLVISHGGAGSSYEILAMGKPLISVENKEVNDSHQWDLLKKLESENYIIWCKDLSNLKKDIEEARKKKFAKYTPPACTIHKEIIKFLEPQNKKTVQTRKKR